LEPKQSHEPFKVENSHPELKNPAHLERLHIEKPFTQLEFDFLGLKNLCVKIPLFQAIKNVPVNSKEVWELCLRKPHIKLKYLQTIHVMGKLYDLMMVGVLAIKYSNTGVLLSTIEKSTNKHTKTISHSHSLTKSWIRWLEINTFISLMDSVGITKSKLHPKIKKKQHSLAPRGKFAYRVLPFGLCNTLATFQ
jgi:hypothetical protein